MNKQFDFSFNKRYLALGTVIYIISSYLFLNASDSYDFERSSLLLYSLIFTAGLIAVTVVIRILFRKNSVITSTAISIMIATLIFILGYGRSYIVVSRFHNNHTLVSNNTKVCGITTSDAEKSSSDKSFYVNVDIFTLSNGKETTTLKKPIKAIVYFPVGNEAPKRNSSVAFDYSFEIGGKPPYRGAFDQSRYLRQKKICYSGYTYNLRVTDDTYNVSAVSEFKNFGAAIRSAILKSCDSNVYNADERQLLEGILLGNVAAFSDELYEKYTNSGLIHIASVSGMHTSYLFILISYLLMLTKLPRRYYVFAAIPILVIFASVSLFTPSVCRAVIMLSVLLTAQLLGRPNDGITALSLAALILTFENPYCLESYSFILSFGATLGILVFSAPCTKMFCTLASPLSSVRNPHIRKSLTSCANYLASSIAVSVSGTLGTAFFCARFFGKVVWGGIPGNILIFPTVAIIFIGGYINCVVGLLSPALADMIARFILNPTLRLTNKIAEIFSNVWFSISVPIPQKVFFVIYIVICTYVYYSILYKNNKNEKEKR